MTPSAMIVALFASALTQSVAVPSPPPTPAILWVKTDGRKEVVRVALLNTIAKSAHNAPYILHGKLYHLGRATPVELHLKWKESDELSGSWTAADYWLDAPKDFAGDAVLSLNGTKQGWRFRWGEM